jgi:hypothetical protein
VSQRLKIGWSARRKVENGSGRRVGSATRGRDWLAPDLTSALLHIEQGESFGAKMQGYATRVDTPLPKTTETTFVCLVVLAVTLDVAARRSRMEECICMELIRCRHTSLAFNIVKTSLARRWRSARVASFCLQIRDGFLVRLARNRSARQSSSLGLVNAGAGMLCRVALLELAIFSPRSPCGQQHIGDWGLWRAVSVPSRGKCCVVEDDRCVFTRWTFYHSAFVF